MAKKLLTEHCMSFVMVARKIFWCCLEDCDGVHHYYRRTRA
jgi:hypothetical protein